MSNITIGRNAVRAPKYLRWKRKSKLTRLSNSKKARLEHVRDVENDKPVQELNDKIKLFDEREIEVSDREIEKVKVEMKEQSSQ